MHCKIGGERLAILVGFLEASCMFTKPAKAVKENFLLFKQEVIKVINGY